MRNQPLRNRISVERCNLKWAQELVTENHYLHKPVDRRAMPFAYEIALDEKAIGTIIMAIPHWNRQRDLFTTQDKWIGGEKHLPTAWQVLCISRLWIEPSVQVKQSNGHASNIGSCAIAKMLRRVQRDWIEHHPPVFPELPYHLKLILAHADLGVGHEGIVYSAANFTRWGMTQKTRARETSRGSVSGSQKTLWIYRLTEPNWKWEPKTLQLELAV